MLPTMLSLILVLLAVYVWQNALKARERARELGHGLCSGAGVQLLDQSVALSGLALARNREGRLCLRRSYAFEVSLDGHDRHRGGLQMLDGRMLSWSLPVTHAQPLAADSNVIEMRRPQPPSLD
ncbi:MAG TPA: DUF3301 domain-containing protein [Rudaea sp.]|jgi:hypothetical protein